MGDMNMQNASSDPSEGHPYSMNASRASMLPPLLLLLLPLLRRPHKTLPLQQLICWSAVAACCWRGLLVQQILSATLQPSIGEGDDELVQGRGTQQ
jgi:hypothetical protein